MLYWGKSVIFEGIRGQAGYDLGLLEGQKEGQGHWNIMRGGREERGGEGASAHTRDPVGKRSQVFLIPEFVR